MQTRRDSDFRLKRAVKYIGALSIFSCSACAQLDFHNLYIHDAGLQTKTATAKADLNSINITAVFDNETVYLDKLESDELKAISDRNAAQRDAEILLFLRGNESYDGRLLFSTYIDEQLRFIVGKSDRASDVKIWRMISAALDDSASGSEDFSKTLAQDLIDNLTKVSDADATKSRSTPSNQNLQAAIEAVQTDLTNQADAKKAGKTASADLEAALKGVSDLDPAKTTQDQLTSITATVSKYISESNPYVRKYVSDNIASKLQALVDATDPSTTSSNPLTSEAKAGLGFLQATLGVGDAFSTPPKLPHPNALAAAQAWLQYVQSGAELGIAEAQTKLNVDRAQLVAVAAQAYFLSRAATEFKGIPTENMLARHGLTDLFSTKKDVNYAVTASLVYYADAWNRGFTRATEIERERYILQRRAKLERSRRAADAWVGSLTPAVQTLADYGAGGLDPQAIANFLNALGLGAIAYGVNK